MRRREIFAWFAAFVAARLVLLAVATPELYRPDELYAGAAAEAIRGGYALPAPHLAWDPYSAGSIGTVLGCLVTFAALGSSLLAIKLVALAFASAAFVVWLRFVDHLFATVTARRLALLWLFAPIEAAKLELMAWGNHMESTLPCAMALLGVALVWGDDARLAAPRTGRRPLAFAAGLAAGIALLWSLVAALTLATIVVALALLGRSTGATRRWFAAGAALGLVLPALFQMAVRMRGVGELEGALRPRIATALPKARQLIVDRMPEYLAPHLDSLATIEWLPWLAVAIAALVVVASGGRRLRPGRQVPAELLIALPPALFVAAYATSGFWVGPEMAGIIAYHYLAPMTPFLLALVALATRHLGPVAGWLPVALLAGLAATGVGRRLPQATTLALTWSGVSHAAWGWHAYEAAERATPQTLAWLDRVGDEEARRAALRGVAVGMVIGERVDTWAADPEQRNERLERLLAMTRPAGADQPILLERIELVLRTADRMNLQRAEVPALLALARRLPPAEATAVIRAAAVDADRPDGPGIELLFEEPVENDAVYGGVGMAAARRRAQGREAPSPEVPERLRSRHDEGYGFEWAWSHLVTNSSAYKGPDVEPRAAARGVVRALELFEPDDAARRRWLDRRLLAGAGAGDAVP